MGLSAGAVISGYLGTRPGNPFKKVIVGKFLLVMLVNPIWSYRDWSLDLKIKKCETDRNPYQCVSKLLIPPKKPKFESIGYGPGISIHHLIYIFNSARVDMFRYIPNLFIGNVLTKNYSWLIRTLTGLMVNFYC